MINEHPITRNDRTGFGSTARRSLAAAVAALLVVGGAVVWRVGASGQTPAAPAKIAAPLKNPAIDELVGTTKALDVSQQQVVDQLQMVQEMLAAQQTETRRSAERITALSGQLEALRQSFATLPPALPESSDTADKPSAKADRPSRSRAAGRRTATRKVARASKARRVASAKR